MGNANYFYCRIFLSKQKLSKTEMTLKAVYSFKTVELQFIFLSVSAKVTIPIQVRRISNIISLVNVRADVRFYLLVKM